MTFTYIWQLSSDLFSPHILKLLKRLDLQVKLKDIFLYPVTFPDGWNLDRLLPEYKSQGFTQHQVDCCSDSKLAYMILQDPQ